VRRTARLGSMGLFPLRGAGHAGAKAIEETP
jgi:hypothetical protein